MYGIIPGMNDCVEVSKEVGVKKASKSVKFLIFRGIMAGMMIGFAALVSTIASMNLTKNPETYGIGKIVQGFVFSGGLIMVVLSGAELFTGNNLMLIALFDRKIGPKGLLKNWGCVYLGNLIGSLFLALLVAFSGIFQANSGVLGSSLAGIMTAKTSLSVGSSLVLGILCNFLVCLAVFMAFGAKTVSGKLLACIFPVMFFVAAGFEHSIANMFYIPVGFFAAGNVDILAFLANLIPVTVGNVIGGAILAVLVYYSTEKCDIIRLCKRCKNFEKTEKSKKKSKKIETKKK